MTKTELKIQVDTRLFDVLPGFCRGVVIAADLNNQGDRPALETELQQCVTDIKQSPAFRELESHERIASWIDAFRRLGMNPNRMPPSIASLVKRVRNGGRIATINPLVAVMNVISMRHILPSGGDDLAATSGSLVLGPAQGTERYHPLGKPDVSESPPPGEWIYYDAVRQEVLCRGWVWRNSHTTRIQPSTTEMAINVDGLPPVTREEVTAYSHELAAAIQRHCGGRQEIHLLSIERPVLQVEV